MEKSRLQNDCHTLALVLTAWLSACWHPPQYGHYSGSPDKQHELTFLDGIQQRAAQAGASVISCNRHALAPLPCAKSLNEAGADLGTIVLVLTGMAESEGHDRTSLGIDPQSLALLQAVHTQLPTVPKILVIVSGGAVSTEEAESVRPALDA
jgi:hypothetical protein